MQITILSEEELNFAHSLINKIFTSEKSTEFRIPVAAACKPYHEVTQNPMDYGTIRVNINLKKE